MICYILKGHRFEDDVISMLQVFYPNTKMTAAEDIPSEGIAIESILENDNVYCRVYKEGKIVSGESAFIMDYAFSDINADIKRLIKTTIFKAHKAIREIRVPWGILTGVRPTKKVAEMKAAARFKTSNHTDENEIDKCIKKSLKEHYFVSEEKIDLAMQVYKAEKSILKNNCPNKISIYIGIPFCPTKCLYCSFTSYSIGQYKDRVAPYFKALEKEIKYISEKIKNCDIESIYIGGGTPTSVNENYLEELLDMTVKYFCTPDEFTVEAGRPDTITREKLRILKNAGVTRISVNPQTLNDKTLRLIGREHTAADFKNAFYLAREEGHKHINTDIILGLPEETPENVEKTMREISELSPESITVHTLAVKRASRLHEYFENYSLAEMAAMERMIEISSKYAKDMSMHPYYMYRQKNMLGNFENVGYAKENCECIYNVQIMEERQSIIALGAGGSTKIYFPSDDDAAKGKSGRVERVFNVKSVDDYINRIDEMIQRKEDFFKKENYLV